MIYYRNFHNIIFIFIISPLKISLFKAIHNVKERKISLAE